MQLHFISCNIRCRDLHIQTRRAIACAIIICAVARRFIIIVSVAFCGLKRFPICRFLQLCLTVANCGLHALRLRICMHDKLRLPLALHAFKASAHLAYGDVSRAILLM